MRKGLYVKDIIDMLTENVYSVKADYLQKTQYITYLKMKNILKHIDQKSRIYEYASLYLFHKIF
jgi:hypothetical protein